MRTALVVARALVVCALGCSSSTSGTEPLPSGGSGGLAGSGDMAGGSGGAFGGSGGVAAGAAGSSGNSGGAAGGSAGGASAGSAGASGGGSGGASTFVLTSPAFANVEGCSLENPRVCAVFPDENVSYGDNPNISPELHWTGAPAGTKSFAVVLFDVTFGQAHWALWNIPEGTTSLAADVPKDTATPATPPGSRQANANFATTGGDGYFGPHIACNVFELQLYALSLSSFSPEDADSAVLVSFQLQELGDSLLGVAKLTGRSGDYMTTCD